MTPRQFVAKWRASTLSESSAAQSHFNDLCRVFEVPTPAEADPEGISFTFEKGLTRSGGGRGWADVWRRGYFAWEYKGKHHDLDAAYQQLLRYAGPLENPPLLIVSDMEKIRIHTNFTNTVQEVHEVTLDTLEQPASLALLRQAFTAPESLRPGQTRTGITEEAAERFAAIAQRLRGRGHDPMRVAHFVNRMLFCLFAEDIQLLPERLFQRMLDTALVNPANFEPMARDLFRAMTMSGGRMGVTAIPWFNGGLFNDDDALPLEKADIAEARQAANLDWSAIEPSIFGTLFERGLDPDKRSQLGAHYTDRESILRIVEPVVLRPLAAEWEAVKAELASLGERAAAAKAPGTRTRLHNERRTTYLRFRDRLEAFRVLDPACGSGNFLYLALLGLKDLEHRVILEAEALGQPLDYPRIGPEAVMGIEINPYAAELARVSIWIGEIQWMLAHGYGLQRSPILKALERIECRDALLNPDGTEAAWPKADAVVGNPPFLGTKLMFGVLGVEYTKALRGAYRRKVSPFADLVCFWFEKAGRLVASGGLKFAGLVSTNSIRGGKNRLVLDDIAASCRIFEAWSDEPWVVDGAAVRVSIVCFCATDSPSRQVTLDGVATASIHADLTATAASGAGANLTKAARLQENRNVAFVGTVKAGKFDIAGPLAREWLMLPTNPNGRPNRDVLTPWMNGLDVVRRPQDNWIVDFGVDAEREQCALYEVPFGHVQATVKPARDLVRRARYRERWWLQAEPCPGMRSAISKRGRYLATPTVAKHRIFVWLASAIQPDHQLVAVARDDDTTFGVLHSRFHELWSLRLGTWLGVGNDPRYTPTTTFETFPFPEGLTPNTPSAAYADDPRAAAIAAAARRLNELREAWLNPPDLVRREPEVVPGFPDRILPRDDTAAQELKKRTLTNLYNARPQWLADAHRALDAAVAAAYGWPADLADDEVLARLLALNQARAAKA